MSDRNGNFSNLFKQNPLRKLNTNKFEIIKIFTAGGIISQGIISIQTTDDNTLEVINRKNIKTEKYDELTKVFYDLKLPLSTDLMMGLPGITVEAFNKDLQRYIDMDVSIKAYPTQLLPNSPMADPAYIEKYKIKLNESDDVLSEFVDIGWRLKTSAWGKGYATEAAQKSIDLGFEKFDLREIIGRTAKDNKGSFRVLEKIGMTFFKHGECDGIENASYFKIEKPFTKRTFTILN